MANWKCWVWPTSNPLEWTWSRTSSQMTKSWADLQSYLSWITKFNSNMTLNYQERMKQQAEQRISFEICHKVNESGLKKTYSLLQKNFFSGTFWVVSFSWECTWLHRYKLLFSPIHTTKEKRESSLESAQKPFQIFQISTRFAWNSSKI